MNIKYMMATILLVVMIGKLATAFEPFFPDYLKTFHFKEGDFVAHQENGKWYLHRIIKIDKVSLKQGEEINISGEIYTLPVDDSLLIIGVAILGEKAKTESVITETAPYDSLEALQQAVKDNSWVTSMMHIPARTDFLNETAVMVAHKKITDEDLEGYQVWKEAFDQGEAGVW